jgi:glycosyltransferase involved in cell wall biosynthesis
MVLLVNASTVKVGGGLTLALNLLHFFEKTSNWSRIILIAPEGCNYKETVNPKIEYIPIRKKLLFPLLRPLLERIIIYRIIKKNSVNKVFTLGNLPLPFKCKQALLFDNPFSTTTDLSKFNLSFYNLIIHKIRNLLFRKRLRYVQIVFAQTLIQKSLLFKLYKNCPEIIIIPNTYPMIQKYYLNDNQVLTDKNKINLVAFSRYYEHKNLEILVEVALQCKQKSKPYKIYLTIDKNQSVRAKNLILKIGKNKLSEYIENLGIIEPFNIKSFYSNFDGLILPSLLESYSTTYAEAMNFDKPIFTSDRDFAHEVCRDHAHYFNEKSANSIIAILDNFYELSKKVNKQTTKVILPTWIDLSQRYNYHLNRF